ncbi:MAG: glycoside hydrolase family 88 protein [Bacteroidales bacterium]|nr:glycoside hydrolase family 88 protein [Bacteroidales bacterium]
MRKVLLLPLVLLILLLSSCKGPSTQPEGLTLKQIGQQLELLDENIIKVQAEDPLSPNGQKRVVPRTINKDGSLAVVPAGDWTSGFYPGVLWYMYELTGEVEWKEKAINYTDLLEDQQFNGSDHDVGFRMFCSYGNALRITGDESYISVLEQSAKTLIARYYANVGCIRSWDFNQENWQCPVIIDNMMNLELLFWASEQTSDPVYHNIAFTHAVTTMENHFRSDNSSIHVVDYDTITGDVRKIDTHQGYSDESAWSRGQAWGLYGYTATYRLTDHIDFLKQAERIAGFLLEHPNMPEDLVPYWDYDAPGIPDEPRDVSAAAIMASALYELCRYSENGAMFKAKADKIMESLGTTYASAPGENYGFILGHSVGAKPSESEVDVPINYADYYYLEALLRKKKLEAR